MAELETLAQLTSNDDLKHDLHEIVLAVNQFYLLIMGILVFSMQLGFTLLEAGGVRKKNVNNILTKVSASSL
jgi:Amt family ammonium transporter